MGEESYDGKRWMYRRRLLEALLVSSTSEVSFRLPTIKDFILSEVVNGTIEYVGGNAGRIRYRRPEEVPNGLRFEREIFKYFESDLEAHSEGRLDPKVEDAVRELSRPCLERSPPDRPLVSTELYDQFMGGTGLFPTIMPSRFSLPQESLISAARFIPSLPDLERENVEGIGKAMRKYIDDDLKFIRETYHY